MAARQQWGTRIGRVLHLGEGNYRWFDNVELTRAAVQDGTRLLLTASFLACAFLVWKAWSLKQEEAA